ncbi:MAG: hypothetical protein LZF60_280034 [Nitrospira sp.]|nr:hypothetical protein [Nitrospira sp.]ULA60998.1 MAG: hypothetical protein LZF60_280034 [Nitrospira sp.]
MALHTHPERVQHRVAGARWSATFIQQCSGGIEQSLLLILWLMVAVSFLAGFSLAAPYDFTANGDSREAIAAPVGQRPADHSSVLAAGFGFQAAGASLITVRTYDVPTGAILSEDSFDLNVKEEGAAERDGNRGRIFAGGIGTDSQGKSGFMLRVYDAETGRFLWEGQLNLLKVNEGGASKVQAVIAPKPSFAIPASDRAPQAFQTLFSVRAVNPMTGRLVWQDQFTPGIRKRPGSAGVSCKRCSVGPVNEPIGHIFDLVVRTYDRTSGVLLWEDSFEEIERIDESDSEPETSAYPQAIPFWHRDVVGETTIYKAALR